MGKQTVTFDPGHLHGKISAISDSQNTQFQCLDSYLRRPCTRILVGLKDSLLKLNRKLIINHLKI